MNPDHVSRTRLARANRPTTRIVRTVYSYSHNHGRSLPWLKSLLSNTLHHPESRLSESGQIPYERSSDSTVLVWQWHSGSALVSINEFNLRYLLTFTRIHLRFHQQKSNELIITLPVGKPFFNTAFACCRVRVRVSKQ